MRKLCKSVRAFQIYGSFYAKMIIRVLFVRQEGAEIVPKFFDIGYLAHMTLIEIQIVVCDNLINTLFS